MKKGRAKSATRIKTEAKKIDQPLPLLPYSKLSLPFPDRIFALLGSFQPSRFCKLDVVLVLPLSLLLLQSLDALNFLSLFDVQCICLLSVPLVLSRPLCLLCDYGAWLSYGNSSKTKSRARGRTQQNKDQKHAIIA